MATSRINRRLEARLGLDTSEFDRELRGSVREAERGGARMGAGLQRAAVGAAAAAVAIGLIGRGLHEISKRGDAVSERRLGRPVDTAADAFGRLGKEVNLVVDGFAAWVAESRALKGLLDGITETIRFLRQNWQFLISMGVGFNPVVPGASAALGRGSPTGRDPRLDRLRNVDVGRTGFPNSFIPHGPIFRPQRENRFGPIDTFDPDGIGFTGHRRDGFMEGQRRIRKMREEASRLAQTIVEVSTTVERTLVRSLSRAVMQFEGMGKLIRDIQRSLLSSLVSGIVSFGMGALRTSLLGGLGFGAAGIGKTLTGKLAKSSVASVGGGASLTIDVGDIPEPTDYGILGTKTQVARLVKAAVRDASRNGAKF